MVQKLFGDREFNKKLLSLILPIAFQQFMLALVSASDAVMLGRIRQDSMSAVSLATQITFVENLFLTAMTIGLSMLGAQYWGKGDRAAVERIFAYVMKLTTVVSFAFFLAALLFPGALMKLFTNEAALIDGGAEYLRMVSPSYLLTGISQIYLCALKNTGRARLSSVVSSTSVMVNITLNAVLIFGLLGLPRLEICGAALATVIARVIEVVWCVLETCKKDSVKLRLRYIVETDRRLRKDFWKYTAPVLGNEIVWGGGFTMYSVIMGHLNSDAVAANALSSVVKNLVTCFSGGLGSGGGIMVGNELGAGRLEKARAYGSRISILAILCGLVSGLFLLAVTPLALRFAGLTEQAAYYLKWMMVMCSAYMVGKAVNSTTIGGIFCAGGDSRFGFLCDAVTMWCFTVPLGFIAAFRLKLPVLLVYAIVNSDEMVKLPAVYKHYHRYKWVRDLTTTENEQGETSK